MFAGSTKDLDQNGAMPHLSIDRARRIALAAQGLTQGRPTGRIDVRHFRRVLRHVGVVQLDSVNVLARAHYMPFFSRLGPYDQRALDRWLWGSGELFEYWGHAASLLPIEARPLFTHRMSGEHRWPAIERLNEQRPGFIDHVYEQVRTRGALAVSDLDAQERRSDAWWGWRSEKVALEWLFLIGKLTSAGRPAFSRLYDLPERVHPEILEEPPVALEDARTALLVRAAESLGVATLADLADYYRLGVPAARPLVRRLVRTGGLEQIEVEGWRDHAYLHPAAVTPRRHQGAVLLSPFDPMVWFRPRVERLFRFEYRIEIYVPAKDRVYGYYVLPFLLDGEMVGRVDLKADRKRGTLAVRAAHVEQGQDQERIAAALAGELRVMAEWLGLEDVEVDQLGSLSKTLARRL
jgi:hypothetical protein